MIIGKVVGTVVSTRKYDSIQGHKLLVVQSMLDGRKERFVAADRIGAGIGQLVLVAFGSAVQAALDQPAPIDALVVGIVDHEPDIRTE
jgi:ethanolamine utilization protein EutN